MRRVVRRRTKETNANNSASWLQRAAWAMPLMRASSPPRPSSPQGYTNTNPGGSGNAHTPDPGSGNPKPNTSTNTNALNPATSIPIVRLDVDAVSDVLAAGLAAALVGHVLFLKGQVPLCVQSLRFFSECGLLIWRV